MNSSENTHRTNAQELRSNSRRQTPLFGNRRVRPSLCNLPYTAPPTLVVATAAIQAIIFALGVDLVPDMLQERVTGLPHAVAEVPWRMQTTRARKKVTPRVMPTSALAIVWLAMVSSHVARTVCV